MMWALGAWVAVALLAAPLVGRHLKRNTPTDAPMGRNGARP